jgi:hypothetical protein
MVFGLYLIIKSIDYFSVTSILFISNIIFLKILLITFTIIIPSKINFIEWGWLSLLLGYIFGVPIAITLLDKYKEVSEFIIGGCGGLVVWNLIYSTVLYNLFGVYGDILNYTLMVLIFIGWGSVCLVWNKDAILIFSTSISGAYLIGKVCDLIYCLNSIRRALH